MKHVLLLLILLLFNGCISKKQIAEKVMNSNQEDLRFANKIPEFTQEDGVLISNILTHNKTPLFRECWNFYLSNLSKKNDTLILRYDRLYKLREIKKNKDTLIVLHNLDEATYFEFYFNAKYQMVDMNTDGLMPPFKKNNQNQWPDNFRRD